MATQALRREPDAIVTEIVSRDGAGEVIKSMGERRGFAESGAGIMYWFEVPLGGVAYPEGFRNFLQPALANPRISKIRFVLDASVPVVRLMVHDPGSNEETEPQVQIYLSTAARTVRFGDGTMQAIRIPDAVLRIRALEHDSLIYALNSVVNQWDSLFT